MAEIKDITFKKLPSHGDKKAFDAFFRNYFPKLTAYACLFLEPQSAEDEVQNLFAYIWENAANIKIHTSVEAYIFKAIYQRCLNQIKQRKSRDYHHKAIESYLMDFELKLFDPETNESIRKLYMEELKEDINAAIDSLPEKCREVFMLSYVYDLKNKEISDVLGVTLRTVENHIYHALKVLRKKLSKHAHILAILFPL